MTTPDDRGRPKRFVQGHNQRGQENPAKRITELRKLLEKKNPRMKMESIAMQLGCSLSLVEKTAKKLREEGRG